MVQKFEDWQANLGLCVEFCWMKTKIVKIKHLVWRLHESSDACGTDRWTNCQFHQRAAFMASLARGVKMMNISTIRKSSKKILLMLIVLCYVMQWEWFCIGISCQILWKHNWWNTHDHKRNSTVIDAPFKQSGQFYVTNQTCYEKFPLNINT